MTQEQKAKAYDEVFRTAQELYNNPASSQIGKDWICAIFPELKESEDEKIRKVLIELVKCNERCGYFMINNITTSSMLAWLEKQGESKSYSWKPTKEQYEALDYSYTFDFEKKELKKIEQKPDEWSEKYKEAIEIGVIALDDLEPNDTYYGYTMPFGEATKWLKSLKDKYTWKPSDEQIKVCKEVYADLLSAKGFNVYTINSELNRLEEQLKKLKE